MRWLDELTESVECLIPTMAGRAEPRVGEPAEVTGATWALIRDVLDGPE